MAEYTAAAAQTVANGNNVLFTATPVCATRCIVHREGSGIVTLRGITNGQCRARFRVNFGGNIAIPTGGTAGAISIALAIAGEALPASTAIVTPAAAAQYPAGDLEAVHKLTDTIKNIDKIEMLEADGYSNNGGDWEARGSYDGMYRDDRYSRRGRDMRGRYSRHDGTDKRLMDELEELMRTIEPGKRDVIRRALEELKEA